MIKKRTKAKGPEQSGLSSCKRALSDMPRAPTAAERWQWRSEREREVHYLLADAIEHDKPLDPRLRKRAASIIRESADRIPLQMPRAKGGQVQLSTWDIAARYAELVIREGAQPTAVIAALAEANAVTIEAIRKAIKKSEWVALLVVGGPAAGKYRSVAAFARAQRMKSAKT